MAFKSFRKLTRRAKWLYQTCPQGQMALNNYPWGHMALKHLSVGPNGVKQLNLGPHGFKTLIRRAKWL